MKTVQRFIGKARMLAAALGLASFGAASVSAATATAVEYFHADFNHYFFTAAAAEAASLDAATGPGGWARTGQTFTVEPNALTGLNPVCRFFSTAFGPKSSHFFTADVAECAQVRTNSSWQFEGTAFHAHVPAAGLCPVGTAALYRLYNNGQGAAPNHRYTTCASIRDRMASRGWIAEGVAMCVTAASSDCGYPVVDTGQTKTYNASIEIAAPGSGQAFYGQDAQFAGTQPNYTKSSDGLTVRDNVTGLTWQKSPDTNGDGIIDSLDKMTLTQARTRVVTLNAANHGGYNDWRLPSIKELYSLIFFAGIDPSGVSGTDTSVLTPFIDRRYFDFAYGDTARGERIIDMQYASSTLYVSTTMLGNATMFGVNFADGRIKGYSADAKFAVRLVRGSVYGTNDFVDNGNSTISDRATGLMWTKGDSAKSLNWQEALAWAQIKNSENHLGYSDWRLPNAKELQGIVDYTRSPDTTSSPAISPLFTSTSITNEAGNADYPAYWTSTTHASQGGGQGASAAVGGYAVYVAFGRAMGYMTRPDNPTIGAWLDVHGAGAQRSDPKVGNPSDYPRGHGPQGDAIRIYNHVRLVRGTTN